MTDHLSLSVCPSCCGAGYDYYRTWKACPECGDAHGAERRGEQAGQPEGSPRLVGAGDQPTSETPARGRA